MEFLAGAAIVIAIIIYLVFYFTHGKYLEKHVVKASPTRETPAHKYFDGVDYIPANKAVLYGHHFASIAGAGPIVGPALALGWGWLPCLLWIWFGNVFIGVVHDYLSLMVSVRYDGKSIGWVCGRVMTRRAFYVFNAYIWFALLLVVAAFGYVISALFSVVPAAGFASLVFMAIAVAIGPLLYKVKHGFSVGTIIGVIAIFITIWFSTIYAGYFKSVSWMTSMHDWMLILLAYIIIAASIPVWVLLQPRDYLNAYILWASLAIGGGALIWLAIQGHGAMILPSFSMFSANVVGGRPSPFWPTIPLVIACGALSGFHSLVGSGTSSKQLDKEVHGLLIGYGGMLTEGFLATLVIGSMGAYVTSALLDKTVMTVALKKGSAVIAKALKSVGIAANPHHITPDLYSKFVHLLSTSPSFLGHWYTPFMAKAKWAAIPYSYAYAVHYAFNGPIVAFAIFATLWITAFALTSLDTATRLGRYAWQELMEPLRAKAETAYRVLSNKWLAAFILAIIGIALAWGGGFLVIWPAFSGMNQLLASLALMTVSAWVAKVQKSGALGKALTIAPAIFLWVTVTVALIWFDAVVVPPTMYKNVFRGVVVGVTTAIGVALNLYLFGEWVRTMRRKGGAKAEAEAKAEVKAK